MNISGCSRNVRSSSLCNLESSALIGHGGNTRGTVDVSKRARPTEGPTRGQKTAHHPEAGSGGVGTERALGANIAEAAAAGGRQSFATPAARAAFEPEDAGGGKTTRGRAVPAQQAKLWHDYGPTLAAEELAEDHGIRVNRETLRQWLIEAKLWRARRSRIERAHIWRPRRARYGELVQCDTSNQITHYSQRPVVIFIP